MTGRHDPVGADESRALNADEQELADLARQPALGALSDADLSTLVARLRERRNRARDLADRQAREARAKAEPSGTSPASGNAGTQAKHDHLSAALDRAMSEQQRRADAAGQPAPTQHDLALKAMALKQAGEAGPNPMAEDGSPLHPRDPDASDGKADMAGTARRTAPSGALDHAGELPSRERSRTRY